LKRNSRIKAIILKDNNRQVLYKKFLDGLCSSEELTLLFDYFKTSDKEELQNLIQEHFNQSNDEHSADLFEKKVLLDVFFKIKAKTHAEQRPAFPISLRWKFSIAAMFLIAFSLVMYLYKGNNLHRQSEALHKNIIAGGNKATLTLPNGKTIDLSEEKDGLITNTNKITYSDGSKIENNADLIVNTTEYITLTTPKGGQYKIVLSDGTQVWLNAASSLKYPAKFTGDKRHVMLTGEAYFEVASLYSMALNNKKIPFIVETATQEVKVLGTHFNINSYADEASVKTTLLEGSVNVSIPNTKYAVLLKPNHESSIAKGSNKIHVNVVDPASAIAWKDGLFRFDKADIYTVMRQISRWYNIDVVYEGKVNYEPFYGEIQRSYDLNEVLNVLKLGGVEFRIEVKNDKKQIVVI